MESKEWQQKFADQVGLGIEEARDGKSDQWISDRTKDLGHPISRTAISEYRRGIRKSMPVTDLMIIAAALRVAPVTLIFPRLPNGEVTLIPSVERPTALDSLLWFTGERPSLPHNHKVFRDLDENGNVQPVNPRTIYDSLSHGENQTTPRNRLSHILKSSRDLNESWHRLRESYMALIDPNHPLADFPEEAKQQRYEQAAREVKRIRDKLTELEADLTDWNNQDKKA